jgi:hypothetical protein
LDGLVTVRKDDGEYQRPPYNGTLRAAGRRKTEQWLEKIGHQKSKEKLQ